MSESKDLSENPVPNSLSSNTLYDNTKTNGTSKNDTNTKISDSNSPSIENDSNLVSSDRSSPNHNKTGVVASDDKREERESSKLQQDEEPITKKSTRRRLNKGELDEYDDIDQVKDVLDYGDTNDRPKTRTSASVASKAGTDKNENGSKNSSARNKRMFGHLLKNLGNIQKDTLASQKTSRESRRREVEKRVEQKKKDDDKRARYDYDDRDSSSTKINKNENTDKSRRRKRRNSDDYDRSSDEENENSRRRNDESAGSISSRRRERRPSLSQSESDRSPSPGIRGRSPSSTRIPKGPASLSGYSAAGPGRRRRQQGRWWSTKRVLYTHTKPSIEYLPYELTEEQRLKQDKQYELQNKNKGDTDFSDVNGFQKHLESQRRNKRRRNEGPSNSHNNNANSITQSKDTDDNNNTNGAAANGKFSAMMPNQFNSFMPMMPMGMMPMGMPMGMMMYQNPSISHQNVNNMGYLPNKANPSQMLPASGTASSSSVNEAEKSDKHDVAKEENKEVETNDESGESNALGQVLIAGPHTKSSR